MRTDQKEIEVALLIYSEKPEEVISDIESLESFPSFLIVPENSVLIHDIYFDTLNNELKENNFSLRVRNSNGSLLLTLKGNAKSTEWGGVERLEIEMPWSIEALTKIDDELSNRNIKLLKNDPLNENDDPVKILTDSGLKIIQDRKNHRRIRNVIKKDQNEETLAELAIDSVTFKFSSQNITFNEVEIESKASRSSFIIESLVNLLIEKFKPKLRRWQHSKLLTGKIIEKLFYDGLLSGLVDDSDNLLPQAFDKIDAHIKTSDF